MPTLFEFGEGILRTHVTWEDIQENCLEVFGEDAVLGPNKSVSSIGDGRGFLSKMCLIEPDWKLESPKKLIVKICSQITMVEIGEKMKGKSATVDAAMEGVQEKMQEAISESVRKIHASEVNVYDLLKKYDVKGIPVPKIYKAVKFTEDTPHKGYIIMEYIENTLNFNIYDNISVDDVKQGLKSIAAMEAASLHFSDEEKASLPLATYKTLFAQMLDPNSIKVTFSMMREFAQQYIGTKLDKLEELISEILDTTCFEGGAELGITPVLVHGDVWSTNLLWTKPDGENLHLSAFVDFQTAHFGYPAADLLRIMGANLSGKDRHANWEKLVEYFYDELLAALGSTAVPYTLEQLKESVRRFYPMAGGLLVPMMGPIFQINQANPDEEQKKKVTEQILEKMEYLIDDMIFFHERNKGLKNGTKKD